MMPKSADPRSGVLEPVKRGEVSSPLPPSALGVPRRPYVQCGLKCTKVRTVGLKMENGCPAGLLLRVLWHDFG